MKNQLKKTAKHATVAMGLFSSLVSPATQSSVPNVQSVMQEVKQTSELLATDVVSDSYFFVVLAKLNEKVALLNNIVRGMKTPEKTVQDLTFINTGLNTLAKQIRRKHLNFLKNNVQEREIFKQYTAEVFKFSVFTEKMREKANYYTIVPSHSGFTSADLEQLVANSQTGSE